MLSGNLAAGNSSAIADPVHRYHFIVPSDLGCPVSANADPATCVPFETMARAALLDPNADSDISQLSNVYFINDSGTTNSGFIHVTGVDFNGSYDWDMGDSGAWNVGTTGTYYLHRYSQTVAGGKIIDEYNQNIGSIGSVDMSHVETLPRLNYRARLGWSSGQYNATLFYNYSSHYYETKVGRPPNVNCGAGCAINNFSYLEPSFGTFDLSLGYDTQDTPTNDYLKNITIQFTVVNLMGIHAPFEYGPSSTTRNPAGFDRFRVNTGRVLGLTLQKRW